MTAQKRNAQGAGGEFATLRGLAVGSPVRRAWMLRGAQLIMRNWIAIDQRSPK